jgi:hypothetical protein
VRILKEWGIVNAKDLVIALRDWMEVTLPQVELPPELQADSSLELPEVEYGPTLFATAITKCNLLKNVHDTEGKEADYQLWLRTLQYLSACEDGEDYVHNVSRGHEGYSEAKTTAKFAELKSREYKPLLCDTLQSSALQTSHCNDCDNCPLNGKIKSPAAIRPAAEFHIPFGYSYNKDVGIVKRGNKDLEEDDKIIFPYQVQGVELLSMDTTMADSVQLQANIHGRQRIQSCYLPFATVTDSRGFHSALSSNGFMLNSLQLRDMGTFMTAWIRQLQREVTPKVAVRTFGWHEEDKQMGFVLGTTMYKKNDTHQISVVDNALTSQYTPSGTFEKWKNAADFIVKQGTPEFCATLAAGFAGPLIRFTGISGALISLVGAASGTGKSSCLRTSQSIWGNPRLGINALNDTTNSVTAKVGLLNNLPVYWDEIRIKEDVADFIRMAFSLGQGKSKQRLSASSQLKHVYSWDTLMVCASNESIIEHVYATVTDSDAGVLRVFELDVQGGSKPIDNLADMMSRFKSLDENYGHAGVKYIEYLVANQDSIPLLIKQIADKLEKQVTVGANERFWFSTVVSLIASAMLAKRAGILDFDIPALKDYLLERFNVMRNVKVTESRTQVDTLHDYMNASIRNRLYTVGINRHTTGKPPPQPLVDPNVTPYGSISFHEGRDCGGLVLPITPLRSWCIKTGTSYNQLRDKLVKECAATVERISLGSGTEFAIGRVRCIYIPEYKRKIKH